jgi:SAM-dependent methyltransferase
MSMSRDTFRRVLKSLTPQRLRRYLRDPAALVTGGRRAAGIRQLLAMRWRRLTPMYGGRPVGTPIVRHYWASFLERHRADVQGDALEIGEVSHLRAYGGDRLRTAAAIDVTAHSPDVTIVADLSRADHVPGERFDCFVIPFTMHILADVEAALYHAIRLLKPGGVLLVNFSCVDYQFPTGLDMATGTVLWVHWCFTPLQVHNVLRRAGLGDGDYTLEIYGNLLTRIAYQLNVPAEELTKGELEHRDPGHPVLVCVRGRRPTHWHAAAPVYRTAWTPEPEPKILNAETGFYA